MVGKIFFSTYTINIEFIEEKTAADAIYMHTYINTNKLKQVVLVMMSNKSHDPDHKVKLKKK